MGMSDNTNLTNGHDRARVADGQEHERRYFLESLPEQFPDISEADLEEAYDNARKSIAPSEDREKLTAKIHELLD